jgi:hypothetical protein
MWRNLFCVFQRGHHFTESSHPLPYALRESPPLKEEIVLPSIHVSTGMFNHFLPSYFRPELKPTENRSTGSGPAGTHMFERFVYPVDGHMDQERIMKGGRLPQVLLPWRGMKPVARSQHMWPASGNSGEC